MTIAVKAEPAALLVVTGIICIQDKDYNRNALIYGVL